MRHRLATLLVFVTAVGCGGDANKDDCQRFLDKTRPIMADMAKQAGKPFDKEAEAKLLAECRGADFKGAPVKDCVLAAKDDAATRACFSMAIRKYADKSKATEAQLQLNKLSKNLKVAYVTNATYPVGKAAPTPATESCKGYEPDAAQWANDPIWSALDFQIDEKHLFRYAYESDGTKATVLATGDLDCDGTAVTYRLEMTSQDGAPVANIITPTLED